MNNRNYCVYLLSFGDDSTYVGITRLFQRRMEQHQKRFTDIVKVRVLHVRLSASAAKIWERIEIAEYRSYLFQINSKGRNRTLGGDGWPEKPKRTNKQNLDTLAILRIKEGMKLSYFRVIEISLDYKSATYLIECKFCKTKQSIHPKFLTLNFVKNLKCSQNCFEKYTEIKNQEYLEKSISRDMQELLAETFYSEN